jgi:hypothetical protein
VRVTHPVDQSQFNVIAVRNGQMESPPAAASNF